MLDYCHCFYRHPHSNVYLHHSAKEEYVGKIGDAKFKNTAINKDEKAPEPLIYTIDDNGFKLEKSAIAASVGIMTSSTPRAGQI